MENKYDLIIVGAGITGLSTGITYKKLYPNNRVLIIEKNSVVGGCVGTFARKGYKFDTVQMITDVSELMEFLGIDIQLYRFQDDLGRLFLINSLDKSRKIFNFTADINLFEEYLKNQFPGDNKKIQNFFKYSKKMYNELHYLKTEPTIIDYIKILLNCPKIIINSSVVYHMFLEKFKFSNPDIYEVFDYFSSFSGLSGNRCASLLTVCAMITALHGSFRPQKGFVEFPIKLRDKYIEMGGEILMKSGVTEILIESGTSKGVELENGEKVYADIVVSTADIKTTFSRMVGYDVIEEANKKYAEKVRSVRMSPSGFAVHIGLDDKVDLKKYSLDKGFNILTTGRQTHSKMFDYWDREELLLSEDEFHFAIISNSLQTGNKLNLVLHIVPVPSKYWIELKKNDYEKYSDEKMKVAKHYLNLVEKYIISDLSKHIEMIDVSTPATYARYINSPTGSNYDMMPVPNNFGKNRLKTRTPIKNLFVPKFSHGIWPSMQAGLQVVDMISEGKIMNGNARYHKS